jgi:hypothetical protein
MQQTAKDVAAQVLSEVDAVAIWKKLILQQEKPQVVASVMAYLSDRAFGRPTQTVQGNPEQPVTIQLQWSSMPEWLPSVTVNQQITHIHAVDGVEDEKRIGGSVAPFFDNQKSTP